MWIHYQKATLSYGFVNKLKKYDIQAQTNEAGKIAVADVTIFLKLIWEN